ncbi:monovalent cation/H+ antiporter subunit D [Coralloluteibacterium stylophorae]|uniref:Monovalent cation/H+ antiporter subunit D n=1 Tax=Coralloluteibacterium stylophorae TaxID=1776034 RepID=A0A8J8AZ93_9GAMM|nr:monovalent cation/H+ antiporter subunit D [Coralloluteibacterium stylophorae]MBS7457883.1 monovalent cation/H+ antiporter subunit D [Coralloluteibacterium stylophorae]
MSPHLAVVPVAGPIALGAVLLLLERFDIRLRRALGVVGALAWIGVGIALVVGAADGAVGAYLIGDWPANLGIALAVDRLSALMVLATALLGAGCLVYACAGWDRCAPHFHTFFQLQLAGLFGAFLTGDLFNLFVFFEVLLIASYGILLAGAEGRRIHAGLQYVAFNVAVSVLFLVALGLLYGVTGTLNMADMAERIAAAPPADLGLIRAAAGVLLVVFCAKAALFPLYLWLPDTYARAPAASAALFAIMTKLGLYSVLRVYSVVFAADAVADVAWPWLLPLGVATLLLSAFGAVAAASLRMLAAHLILFSAALLFVAFALDSAPAVAAGLYYLVHSALAGGALFLFADLVRRQRRHRGDDLTASEPVVQPTLLGLVYLVLAVSLIGLPPLPGFIAKFALLAAIPDAQAGWLFPAVLVSSLLVMIAMARAGSRLFWGDADPEPVRGGTPPEPARALPLAGLFALLGLNVAMALGAQPVLAYAQAAAEQMQAPAGYLEGIRRAEPGRGEVAP